jgi:hypothetical protein
MNPIMHQRWTPEERARSGIRGLEDLTTEERALLQETLAGWTRERAPQPERPRHRRPFMRTRRTATSTEGDGQRSWRGAPWSVLLSSSR